MQERQKSRGTRGFTRSHVLQRLLPLYRPDDQPAHIVNSIQGYRFKEPRRDYRTQTILTTLIDRLDSTAIVATDVIRWGCPVPAFGDLTCSQVATLGLNPSNREFVDDFGQELEG